MPADTLLNHILYQHERSVMRFGDIILRAALVLASIVFLAVFAWTVPDILEVRTMTRMEMHWLPPTPSNTRGLGESTLAATQSRQQERDATERTREQTITNTNRLSEFERRLGILENHHFDVRLALLESKIDTIFSAGKVVFAAAVASLLKIMIGMLQWATGAAANRKGK